MRRALLIAPAAAVLMMTAVTPASAHSAPPCADAGGPGHSDYAQHHIVALAHDQALGDGGHKPGEHGGFSLCQGVHD